MVKQMRLEGEDYKIISGVPLGDACDLAYKIQERIQVILDNLEKVEIVGSIRRQKAIVNDIDFVVNTEVDKYWDSIKDYFVKEYNTIVLRGGQEILTTLFPFKEANNYIQVDFFRTRDENYGIYKLIRTGSKEHNVWLATRAIKTGFRLFYSKGLMKGEYVVAGEKEEDVFTQLGLAFIEPKQREMVNGKPIWMK